MRSGIPASITLAQGIHESSWGKGELAVKSNNHFGIKCKSYWKGPSYYYKDDDFDKHGNLIKSCFRAYENPEKSYIDHTDFLMNTAHYQNLFNYSNTDYRRWAKGLKKCGYATDKEYANKLIRTIEKYQLYKYDTLEKQELVSAPKYKIPKKSIEELMIPSGKNEIDEYSIVEQNLYSVTNVPPAVLIPEDYKRRPKEVVVESRQTLQTSIKQDIKEEIEFEETAPPIIATSETKTETHSRIYTKQLPEKTRDYDVISFNKESIIPSAFASTKRAYHLTRKPRTSNSSIR